MSELFQQKLHSLPFLWKRDKETFYNIVLEMKDFARSNELLLVDLIYTIYNIKNISDEFWLDLAIFVLENIVSKIWYKEILKLISLYTFTDKIRKFYIKILDESNSDEEIFDICFILTKDFVKMLLCSKLHNISFINPELGKFLINEGYKRFKNVEKKLLCIEKIVRFYQLDEEHIDFLESIFDIYAGKVIDIFLHSNDKNLIEKAEKKINTLGKRFFEVDNNAHHFEIDVKIENDNINLTEIIMEIINIGSICFDNIESLYSSMTFLLNNNYKYRDISLKSLIKHVWETLKNTDEKIEFAKVIAENENICSYGYMLNIALFLQIKTGITCVIMNQDYFLRDEVIKELNNPDVWLFENIESILNNCETLKNITDIQKSRVKKLLLY